MSRSTVQDASMAETQYQVVTPAALAGTIKYAKPQDLPSFPSHGLRQDGAAAGAAASLGWANQKPINPWRPDKSSSASAAAVLAKDYKMAPQWEPNISSAGAKAALLATQSAGKSQNSSSPARPSSTAGWGNSAAAQATQAALNQRHSTALKSPSKASSNSNPAAAQAAAAMKKHTPSSSISSSQAGWGNSAATQAFKTSQSVRKPPTTPSSDQANINERNGLGSLSAAQSAMPARRRPRAASTPNTDALEAKAAASALSAASAAHGPTVRPQSSVGAGGASAVTSLPRSMFTSNPAFSKSEDEKRTDLLHASAVAMAKKMYTQQEKMATQTRNNQDAESDVASADDQPRPYVNLQEAAYKMAQERLAKLEAEHGRSREYQEYYGNSGSTPGRRNTLQRRFTLKPKLRRRSSSEGDGDDRQQSERIRQQMSIFSTNLSKVDEQKRSKDREMLLAAAQRNVKARLQGMDDKVYADTGKSRPPKKLSEWELKAHEAAQQMHTSRNKNHGKVDMGGGMFMSPEDVDAIAMKKVQPVLDEINEKVAVEREKQEVIRLEAEAKKKDEEKAKERDREIKAINKQIRDDEKREEKERRQHEKAEQKAQKDAEHAIKAEEKRQAKEEKRKSKLTQKQAEIPSAAHDAKTAAHDAHDATNDTDSDENEDMAEVHPQPMVDTDTANHSEARSPKEAGSPTHKVKSWLKSRFTRPRGKSSADAEGQPKGFVGGAALHRGLNDSTTSLDNRANSMRDVALAGKGRGRSETATTRDSEPISVVSSDDEGFKDARDDLERTITPPTKIRDPNEEANGSPTRDSRFREVL
ncbi:Eisosome protein 1 like [Verticillium longisporum]|uniref:Eisosome protein 1 like n=1 Tax=Verticillium longisporum TaxID=100787 RepID=A0A8I2ZCB9_VERLO|nr:Eisosome protein 1 like [Verticillium longisporum]